MQESLVQPLLARHFQKLNPSKTWSTIVLLFGLPMVWLAWEDTDKLATYAPLALALGLLAIGVHIAQHGGEVLNEWVRGGAVEEIESTGTAVETLTKSWQLYLLQKFALASAPIFLTLFPVSFWAAGSAVSFAVIIASLMVTLTTIQWHQWRAFAIRKTETTDASQTAIVDLPEAQPLVYRESVRNSRRSSALLHIGCVVLLTAAVGVPALPVAGWTALVWSLAFFLGSMSTLDAVSGERRQRTFETLLQTRLTWQEFKENWLTRAASTYRFLWIGGLIVLPIAMSAHGKLGVLLGILTAALAPAWLTLGARLGLYHSCVAPTRSGRGIQVCIFFLNLIGGTFVLWVLLRIPVVDLLLSHQLRDVLAPWISAIQPILPAASALLAGALAWFGSRSVLDKALERTWRAGQEPEESQLNTLNPAAIFRAIVVLNLFSTGLTCLKGFAGGFLGLSATLVFEFALLLFLYALHQKSSRALLSRHRLLAAGLMGWLGGYLLCMASFRLVNLELGGVFSLILPSQAHLGAATTLQLCLAAAIGSILMLRLGPPVSQSAKLPPGLALCACLVTGLLVVQAEAECQLKQMEREIASWSLPAFPETTSIDPNRAMDTAKYAAALKACWSQDIEQIFRAESSKYRDPHRLIPASFCEGPAPLPQPEWALLDEALFGDELFRGALNRRVVNVGRRLLQEPRVRYRWYPSVARTILVLQLLQAHREDRLEGTYPNLFPLGRWRDSFEWEKQQRERVKTDLFLKSRAKDYGCSEDKHHCAYPQHTGRNPICWGQIVSKKR